MNAAPPVSRAPTPSAPAQQSPAVAVNSAKSRGKGQDFAAALSNAGAKPARKTAGVRAAAPGSVGGHLPAAGNLSPPPTSPVAAASAAARAAQTADVTPKDTPKPGTAAGSAAISGAQGKIADRNPRGALLDPLSAASISTAAASPQAEVPAAEITATGVTATGVATTALAGPHDRGTGPAAASAEGLAAAKGAAAIEGLASAQGAAAAGALNKPISAAAATAATKAATSAPSTAEGSAAASSNTSAWTNTGIDAPAATAAAMSAAATVLASGKPDFAGAADSPSAPTNDLATPAAGPTARGAGGPKGAPVPALAVGQPAATAAAATAGANAQTVATLADAFTSDKHLPSGTEYSLLSATVDSAAGALQLSVNTLSVADAAPTATLKVTAGVDTPEFGQGLAERVSFMVDNNLNGAKLQVNPPQLGPIEVRIAVQGNHAQVWLTSHSAVTRDALESSSPKLREMLGAQGFGQVTVDISQRSFQEHAAQPQPYDWTPSATRAAPVSAVQSTATASPRSLSGAVDAYA